MGTLVSGIMVLTWCREAVDVWRERCKAVPSMP